MTSLDNIEYASVTDVGIRRSHNQDGHAVLLAADLERWRIQGHLFLVADGMGAHAVGEKASEIAADIIPHTYQATSLHNLAALYAAPSRLVIIPIQDLFGWRERINLPGTVGPANWSWRLPLAIEDMMDDPALAARMSQLRAMIVSTGR